MNTGIKFDEEKLKLQLIPPELIKELGKVLTFGSEKYGDRNWEEGMDPDRIVGALHRHLWSWQSGERYDDETGYSHLSHAACCIAFLVTYEQRGMLEDNTVMIQGKEVE